MSEATPSSIIPKLSPEDMRRLKELEADIDILEDGFRQTDADNDQLLSELLGEIKGGVMEGIEYTPAKGGELKIMLVPFMSPSVRAKVGVLIAGPIGPGYIEKVYDLMAEICIDEPWNSSKTWEEFQFKSGVVPSIFKNAIEKIVENQKRISRFRHIEAGPGPNGGDEHVQANSDGDRPT